MATCPKHGTYWGRCESCAEEHRRDDEERWAKREADRIAQLEAELKAAREQLDGYRNGELVWHDGKDWRVDTLRERLAAAETLLARWVAASGVYFSDYDLPTKDMEKCEAKARALLAGVRSETSETELAEVLDYAGHRAGCLAEVYAAGEPGPCTCGWDAMRKRHREGRCEK